MIELIEIFLLFGFFSVLLFVPINNFGEGLKKYKVSQIEISTFNLIINLNLLLFLSLLNYSLDVYQAYLILLYLISFFIIYYKNLSFFYKNCFKYSYVFVVFFILAINVASELKLGWDAQFFYYIKSLYFFENHTISNLNDFQYNRYHPHFGSYLWGFFRWFSVNDLEYFGRFFYLFIFCISVFYLNFKEKNNYFNIVLYLIIIILIYQYKYFSGLQDILLFSILAIISKYIHNYTISKDKIYLFYILLSCNLMLWIKSEGLVYSLIVILIINFLFKEKIKTKILITVIFLISYLLKKYIYMYYNFNQIAQDTYSLSYIYNLNFEIIIYKLKYITSWLIYYSLDNIIITVGVIFLLVGIVKKYKYNYENIIRLHFFLTIGFIYSAYIFRDHEILHAIRVTMERLLMSSSGFYLYYILNKIEDLFKKKAFKIL
ncbi:hypothetical protein N9C76_00330 [Candidatus Pelagibacter sp.]|nr:hypothetical protein [Candidatus Pelagibacter sp.]